MNLQLDDQEIEDLNQVLYAKIKELDAEAEKSDIFDERKRNWCDRLEALYKRLTEL